MSNNLVPDQFRQLEPFARDWALATEAERLRRRFSSSFEELQAFYGAVLPQMDAIISYLNEYSSETMPKDVRRLFYIALSLAEIAPAVELFKQPRVPDGFDVNRLVPVEDKGDFWATKIP